MHLYEISFGDHDLVHVVARTPDQAVEIFATWRLVREKLPDSFTVGELPIEGLVPEQKEQVRSALAAGLVGVAHYSESIGWTFSPPLWQPLTDEEMAGQGGAA